MSFSNLITTNAPEPATFGTLDNWNAKRACRIGYLRRQGLQLATEVNQFLNSSDFKRNDTLVEVENIDYETGEIETVTETQIDRRYLLGLKYVSNLYKCGSHTLIRENADKTTYIGAHTCKHKLCPICNSERKKQLRRKYLRFFEKNVLEVKIKGEKELKSHNIRESYDFQHLTLTLPHPDGKFAGSEIYIDSLVSKFNFLRKQEYWKENVAAGEYAVEFTRGKNGYHIHLHALLLVKKGVSSRNDLYEWLFTAWNWITRDQTKEKTELTEKRKEGIKQSFSFKKNEIRNKFIQNMNDSEKVWIDSEELNRHIDEKFNKWMDENVFSVLDARGATMIGLENLYFWKKNEDGKLYKYHINQTTEPELIVKGVMECLKYHFSPITFQDDNGKNNIALIVDLLPVIYKLRLYSKFGAFYGVKELNLTENDIDIALEEVKESEIEDTEGTYFTIDSKNIYPMKQQIEDPNNEENRMIIYTGFSYQNKVQLNARSLIEAFIEMINYSLGRRKNEESDLTEAEIIQIQAERQEKQLSFDWGIMAEPGTTHLDPDDWLYSDGLEAPF